MEEKIHDDKLDEYVRKSFEDYEAMPSPEMWNRVEAELLPILENPSRGLFLKYRWQLLAASMILLLLATLLYEHNRYESELKALKESYAAGAGRRPYKTKEDGALADKKSAASTAERADSAFSKTDAPQTRARVPETNPVESPQHQLFPVALQAEKALVRIAGPIQNDSSTTQVSAGPEAAVAADGKAFDLSRIAPRTTELPWPDRSPVSLKTLPIKPRPKPSDWYIGVHSSVLAIREKPPTLAARPGRYAFASKPDKSDITTICWLKAGKKINARLSLESGLGYQKNVRTATHSPRFRFADGVIPVNPMGYRRNFNYELSTYNGTAEVSLRMEQVTPGNPPADDEPVSSKITTTEHTEELRIPILLRYGLNSGRLQIQAKAGLLGNIMLKNEVNITAWVSQNARFRPVDGQTGYTLQLNPAGKFSLGYWLSGGLDYRFTQHLGLVAEPTLVGDFSRKDRSSRKLPNRVSLGVNLGVNYYF